MLPHSALLSQLFRLTSPLPDDAELLRRWVECRDEYAFTALVSRHGRMVFGVCRRVLGNSHDAEDAFQAVFLTLARKAASLRHPEALPGWLHGVAVRLARKARTAAMRRHSACRVDCKSALQEPADPHPDPLDALSARELLGLIDREIARLPETYRLPLVLCDLEGRTQAEAAQLLGWTLGSFRGRLLRGRERLRTRLVRRGIAPAVLAAACVQGTTDAAALTVSVSRLAVRFVSSPEAVQLSPSVAALVREGIRGMMLTKLKLAAVVLLAACTLVAGAGLLAWSMSAPQPAEDRAEDKSPPAPVSVKPQVRRDQAGDPLPAEAISRLGTIRLRHGHGVLIYSLAFAPDGKTLVSAGSDALRIWEIATGKQIRRIDKGSSATNLIDISPDGKLAAVAMLDRAGYVGVMEVATGQFVRRFSKRQVWSPCFSPGGKMIATFGHPSSEIDLWDSATGNALGMLKGHQDQVTSVIFSTDEKTLISAGDDRTIRFWDVAAGKELRQIRTENGVEKIALSPDGRFLASLGHVKHENAFGFYSEAVILLWDARTGKELRRLTMRPKDFGTAIIGFTALLFTRDGKALVTGGFDGVIRIWDAATGKEMQQFSGFGGAPMLFVLHPDGKTLAVASGGSTISLIRLDTGTDLLALSGHRAGIGSVLLKSGGRVAVTASSDGRLRFWDARTGRAQRDRATEPDAVIRILPGEMTYLSADEDRKLRIRDLDTGKEVRVLQGWKGHPSRFTLSPDGHILAQIDADKKVHLINSATGEVLHTLAGFNLPFMGMSFSPDGRRLFIWSGDKTVTVWDTATGAKRRQLSGPTQLKKRRRRPGGNVYLSFTAKLSPDGKLLAFGFQHDDLGLPVLDTITGKEVRRFTTGKDGVSELEFSPDGKSIAWGGWRDGTVYLGEIATGQQRHRFTGHEGRIYSLAFSADGQTLISGSEDTTALVWDLTGRLTTGTNFGKALSAEELERHWETLAGDDTEAAYRAIPRLAAGPTHSIPFLRTRLRPVAPVDEERVQQWIADLDSDQFAVREKATSELKKAGAAALHAMRKALTEKPALEKRRRLEPLIEAQEREEWSPSSENLRSRRAIEVLERVGTAEAKDVLTMLASGAPGAWQTLDARAALQRLAARR